MERSTPAHLVRDLAWQVTRSGHRTCHVTLNSATSSLISSTPECRKVGLEEGSATDSQDHLRVSSATQHLMNLRVLSLSRRSVTIPGTWEYGHAVYLTLAVRPAWASPCVWKMKGAKSIWALELALPAGSTPFGLFLADLC